MGREIKFRFWDTQNKRWANDAFLYIDEDGTVWEIEERSWAMQSYMRRENVSDRYERVEYTGLRDKNGREIYEGDIVEREFDYPNIGKFTAHGVVTWGHWYAGFMVPFKWNGHNKVERFKDQWVDANPRLEVIGNIYENADLLETAGESK